MLTEQRTDVDKSFGSDLIDRNMYVAQISIFTQSGAELLNPIRETNREGRGGKKRTERKGKEPITLTRERGGVSSVETPISALGDTHKRN